VNQPTDVSAIVPTVTALRDMLGRSGYLADDGLATALFCSVRLGQPILLEGEAGVGKTSAAKSLALALDEIDRADEHFEAFLLELLAERAITVPEIGTISAAVPPIAVLTSNRTRDLHDALKRRCLYHWIDHPKLDQVVAIVRERVPGATEALAVQVSAATGRLRTLDLQKSPGTAEVIDWVQALHVLGLSVLDQGAAATTLGSVLKYREDRDVAVGAGLAWVVGD
jgi:MoxR-like ATPase